MKVCKVLTEGTRIASEETFDVDKDCYDVVWRAWARSDGEIIREWTLNEYIHQDPHEVKHMFCDIDGKSILVVAHCIEERNVFTKNAYGYKVSVFTELYDYDRKFDEE